MKNLTVIDAINELIKGVNIAFTRNAYNMVETRDIINAIEFLGATIQAQSQQAAAVQSTTPVIAATEAVPPAEENPTPSEK